MSAYFLVVGNSLRTDISLLAGSLAGTTCANSTQAFDMLTTGRYQAVFCDLRMPGTDGIEFMSQVLESFPEVAFVMVTEPQDLRYGILAMISGASDYVQTPLGPETVTSSLNRALRRKRFERVLVKPANSPVLL